jgi:hypothetical protein
MELTEHKALQDQPDLPVQQVQELPAQQARKGLQAMA